MSKLSRAVKFIMGVWIVAFCFAIPQAIQFGVVSINGGHSCTVSGFLLLLHNSFFRSAFFFYDLEKLRKCHSYGGHKIKATL